MHGCLCASTSGRDPHKDSARPAVLRALPVRQQVVRRLPRRDVLPAGGVQRIVQVLAGPHSGTGHQPQPAPRVGQGGGMDTVFCFKQSSPITSKDTIFKENFHHNIVSLSRSQLGPKWDPWQAVGANVAQLCVSTLVPPLFWSWMTNFFGTPSMAFHFLSTVAISFIIMMLVCPALISPPPRPLLVPLLVIPILKFNLHSMKSMLRLQLQPGCSIWGGLIFGEVSFRSNQYTHSTSPNTRHKSISVQNLFF